MWAKPEDIGRQTEQLLRVVEPVIFRFILVQAAPQFAAADAFSNALQQKFPNRSLHRIKLNKQGYTVLMQEIEAAESGFVLLENFDRLLENTDLCVGFNQRRDRIAARPVALIVFLPTGIVPLRLVQDRIPDFWSFRAFTLEIKYRYLPDLYPIYEPEFREPVFHLNFDQKKAEIERLQRLIAQTPESEAYLHANLLIQLAGYFTDLFWWPQGQEAASHALMLLQTLPKDGSATELEFDAMYLQAVILKDKEAFAEAVVLAEKATKLAADQRVWERVLKGLNLQGAVRLKEGRLEEAKDLFEQAWNLALRQSLGETTQEIIAIASIGIVLRKMGDMYMAESNLEIALQEAKKQPGFQYLRPVINAQRAILYKDTDRYEEADRATWSHDDFPGFGFEYLVEASFKAKAGFYASTLTDVEHAAWLLKLNFGENYPVFADCYLTKAWGLMNTKGLYGSDERLQDHKHRNKPVIEKLLDDAVNIYEKYYPENAEKRNYAQFIRCHLYWEFNDPLKAETELNVLIGRIENSNHPNPAMLAKCYALLSRSLQEQGRWEEAVYPADKALALTADLVGLPEFETRFINITKGGINQRLNQQQPEKRTWPGFLKKIANALPEFFKRRR